MELERLGILAGGRTGRTPAAHVAGRIVGD
jgi:hypothetical protein